MKKLLITFILLLLGFFIFSSPSKAETVQCSATVIGACGGDANCIDSGNGTCACKFSITCTKPAPLCCRDSGGCPWSNGTTTQTVPQWSYFTNFSCANVDYDPEQHLGQAACQFNYSKCSAADRCEDFTPNINNVTNQPPGPNGGGGTGFSANGVILAGLCAPDSSLQYDSSGNLINPNAACISGGQYKQCCTPPNGTTPTSSCQSGGCPNGDVPPPGRTTCTLGCTAGQACTGTGGCAGTTSCPNGQNGSSVCTCPTPKYKCSGTACLRNDALGDFTTSNCDNRCGTCETAPTYSPPKNTPKFEPGPCNPNATSCTAPCTDTCTDPTGKTCSATSCVSVWKCQNGTQWYNPGTYFSSCPGSCSAPTGTKQICVPGSSQITCDQTTCQVPPGQ